MQQSPICAESAGLKIKSNTYWSHRFIRLMHSPTEKKSQIKICILQSHLKHQEAGYSQKQPQVHARISHALNLKYIPVWLRTCERHKSPIIGSGDYNKQHSNPTKRQLTPAVLRNVHSFVYWNWKCVLIVDGGGGAWGMHTEYIKRFNNMFLGCCNRMYDNVEYKNITFMNKNMAV